MTSPYYGRYVGQLLLRALPDGRLMRLVEPFAFEDSTGKRWSVRAGIDVDGASIPQILWSVVGGPFSGPYRDASVIHDYYCDTRIEPWQDVHRVFYAAMKASGVAEPRAMTMYAAVRFGGPRWSLTTVRNNRLALGLTSLEAPAAALSSQESPPSQFTSALAESIIVDAPLAQLGLESVGDPGARSMTQTGLALLNLAGLEALIEAENPNLDQIDAAIDMRVRPEDFLTRRDLAHVVIE